MASTAAVLNIMVAANTAPASAQLTALQGQLAKTTAQANTTSTTMGSGLSKGGKMAAVGLGAAAVAAIGVGKALTASVGAARSFESSFAEVRKTVDTNEAGFKRIERGLRNLAKQIPVPVEELNNLAGEAGALGIAAKDIVAFTRVASQLGTTTDMSSSDAANALARLANIMGTSSKRFENMASALVGLGNAGASTESEIAAMALRIASTGKQVGLSEADVLGFASALSSVGIEAEAGGSAISRAFSMISEAVATGNEKLSGFAKVAQMSVPSFSRLFEKNAAKAMLAFIRGLGEIKKNGGNALVELEKLGINEIRLRNALLSAAGAGDLFNKQLRIASSEFKANNALSSEAEKRYATFDSQVTILKNNLNDLAISVGQALLPGLKRVVTFLNQAAGPVTDFFSRLKDGVDISKTFTSAIPGVGVAVNLLGKLFEGDGQEKKSILQRLREDTESAMDYLKVATGQEQSLRARQKEAIAGVQKAQQRLNHARKQHGPNSYQASVAEAELAGAMNRSAKAQKRLTRAEQTTGAVRRATKAIITDQVGQIKIEIAQNKKLINQKDRKIELLKREQAPSREIKKLQGQIVDLADKNQNKQGKLNKLILEAANKVGPKFANSLERLTARTAKIREALNELPAPLRKMGGTAETQFDRAGKSAKGFRGAIDRTKKRVNDDLRGMPPVLRSSTGTMMEIFRDRMDALGTYGKPRVSKRAGGVIRGAVAKFAAGGLVPAAVSPGEMISYRGSSMIVPGRPEPRDSVLMGLPTGAKVFTWDGQKRLLEGASEGEALRRQAPHFAKGGIVKPEILGGSPKSNRLANTQVGMVHKRASKVLESAQERSRASSSGAAFIGPPPGMAQLGNNAWVDSNTWTVASYLANKFGLQISSNYRSPAHNAAVGGVPNSSHTRGTPSNPGAFDFVPASSAMQSFAGQRVAGIVENLIHDVGSGLHNHIAFFKKGGFVGNINKVYPGIQAPDWSGYKLPGYVIAALAQAAGMPGRTMEQMTRGESLGRPGSWGHDANGYSTGYGLWAITDPYANDLAAKVGGYKNFLNPVLNAWAANVIYRRQGLRAWYGDQYVTGGNLDYTGKYDIRKALGGYGYQGALYMASKGRLGEKPKGKAKFGPDKGKDKAEKAREAAKKKAKQRRIARKIARMAAKGLQFPGQTKLAEFEAGAEKLVEQIDLYDREATADWSPAGSEYDQAELSSLIAYYTDLLNNYIEQRNIVIAAVKVLQGRIAFWEAKIQATENPGAVMVKNGEIIKPGKKWQIKGWQKAIANARSTIGSLGEKRLALEGLTGDGGAIGDTRFTLKELGATTSPTDTGAADSEIADLLRQQLQETQRALAISQAQMPIFQQFMPRFHQGGIVQGPNGAERPVMAQAGEGIFTRDQMRAMGSQNITVVIEDAAIDSNRIRVEVDGVIQDKVSTVRRQGSNRRFTTSR